MSKIKNTINTILAIAILIIIPLIGMAILTGIMSGILFSLEEIPYLSYSLKLIITTLAIILMYELGKKVFNEKIKKDWKSIVLVIGIIAFYVLIFLFHKDPETGYKPEFNLEFYLTILLPTITALLIGIYHSNKQ